MKTDEDGYGFPSYLGHSRVSVIPYDDSGANPRVVFYSYVLSVMKKRMPTKQNVCPNLHIYTRICVYQYKRTGAIAFGSLSALYTAVCNSVLPGKAVLYSYIG